MLVVAWLVPWLAHGPTRLVRKGRLQLRRHLVEFETSDATDERKVSVFLQEARVG